MRLYGLLDPQREVAIIQSMARKMRIQYRHLNATARALVRLIIVGLTVLFHVSPADAEAVNGS
jgi:hypothetical protein